MRAWRQAPTLLCLCGDLTDYGLREEAILLVSELTVVGKKPVLCVLGNHDFESGNADDVRDVLCESGAIVLCGESYETNGVGFAGTKGFGGGFGEYALEPWGEPSLKALPSVSAKARCCRGRSFSST